MTWVRLDDQFPFHPKALRAGKDGRALFVAGLCYSAQHETDGHLPTAALPLLLALAEVPKKATKALVDAGLWDETPDGFEIHDFLEYQPSSADLEVQRRTGSRRRALHDDRELIARVRSRDGDACRYCGQRVNWRDRKGTHGGTYDHVDPLGPNTLGNVVVACRSCNAKKGHRTPEEAGMPLRPIGDQERSTAHDLIPVDSVESGSSHPDPYPDPLLRSSSGSSTSPRGSSPVDNHASAIAAGRNYASCTDDDAHAFADQLPPDLANSFWQARTDALGGTA